MSAASGRARAFNPDATGSMPVPCANIGDRGHDVNTELGVRPAPWKEETNILPSGVHGAA